MCKQLIFLGGVTAFLLGSFASQAQTNRFYGDLSVEPSTINSEKGHIFATHAFALNDLNGTNPWTFVNQNNRLQLVRGYVPSTSTFFESDGSVSFPQRVSIGDVSCPTGTTCTNALGLNGTTLAVAGNIAARGKITAINNTIAWPDYVFRRGYRLRPLADVARYVQLYHHLPDVPSAAQVQQEGVELAAMNATLLRKVEELTLYLVQLQAANQALAERVARLEATR